MARQSITERETETLCELPTRMSASLAAKNDAGGPEKLCGGVNNFLHDVAIDPLSIGLHALSTKEQYRFYSR